MTLELIHNAERRAVPAFRRLLVMAPVCRLRLAAAALLLAFLASADAQRRPGKWRTDPAQQSRHMQQLKHLDSVHIARLRWFLPCMPAAARASCAHVRPLA